MDISVILPTYCERDNIENLIAAIETSLLPLGREIEILVVDDNSPDCTAQVVQAHTAKPGVTVRCLVREQERGLATAIRHGIQQARGERIVVMDTDFNHSPSNIPQMVTLLDQYDLVVGSRFVKGGGMEDRKRYVFSLVYNWFIQLVLWHGIHDSLSGFFAMRRGALLSLDLASIFRGYGEYFIRLTYLAFRQKMKIMEVPVFYTLRQHGFSKSNFGSMLRDYTAITLSLRFRKPGKIERMS
jgi:dolichol-phosphate mannosyltransferase